MPNRHSKTPKAPKPAANEGEGSRTADRNYREGIKKHLQTHDVEQEAREAEKALDDEGQRKELEAAERKGRQH
jgi:hypothetical protein